MYSNLDIQKLLKKTLKDIETVNSTISNMGSDISNLSNIANQINNINNQIATINTTLEDYKTNLDTTNSNVSQIDSKVSSINTEIDKLKTNISNLQNDVNTNKANIKTNSNNITALNTEVDTIKDKIVELNTAISSSEELTLFKEKVTTLENTVNDLSTTVNDIDSKFQPISDSIDEIKTKNEEITNSFNDINTKLTTQEGLINTNKTNIELLNEITENLKNDTYTKSEVDGKVNLKANSSDVYTKAETYSQAEVNEKIEAISVATTSYTKAEINIKLAGKVDVDEVYTRMETDTLLDDKANVCDVYKKTETYSQTEIDNKLGDKADSTNVYSKTDIDTKLSDKANTSDIYTQTEIDTKLGDKADSDSVYTKTEIDSKLSSKANSSDVYKKTETYSQKEVNSKISSSVNNIKIGGRNLIVHTDEYKNRWLDANGSLVTNNTTNVMKDFIPVTEGEILYFTKTPSGEYWRWNWYDKDKNFIARTTNNSNSFSWIVPTGACYIWVSYPNTGDVQLERATKPSDFRPAPEDVQANIDKMMVDIKYFGAKGDGTTNDATAVQKFLDFCSEKQAIGKVTNGTYILGSQLVIKSNTHLIFEDGAEFKQTHTNTMINIQNNSHTGYNGYHNIKIENGTFNCNGDVVQDPMNCFFIQHAYNVEFIGCTFKNVYSLHSLDINGSSDIRVINCRFLNTFDSVGKDDREAIQIDMSDNVNGETAVCWDYTPTKNILVEGCYFGKDNSSATTYTCAVGSHNVRYGKSYENIIVRNCIIDGCTKYGITGWKWNNAIIEGNIIQNCAGGIKLDTPHRNAVSGNDITGAYKGLETSGGNKILNNTITGVTSSEGIFIRGKYVASPKTGESYDGTISNCLIEGNNITVESSSSAIVLLNTHGTKVNGNTVNKSGADGIRCYSSYDNIITGNNIYTTANYGISVSNSTLTGIDGCRKVVSNIINSNIIEGSAKTAIFITGGANNTSVIDNVIKRCNTSATTTIKIIDISAQSNDVIVSNNRLLDNKVFQNLIYVTNTCNRVLVTNNVTNSNTGSEYFNDSVDGVTINNINDGTSTLIYFTPEMFGAKGDGTTDDTPAFKKACIYARDNGGIKLYVPNKIYVINGYMDLYSNTEIIFAKGAKIIRTANTTTSYLFTVGRVESEGTTGYGGGAKNIHIKGGTFVGINEVNKNISFTMNHAQHCIFEDMEFYYGNSNGHVFDLAGCDDITIKNCTFNGRVFVAGKTYVEAIQIDNSTSGSLSNNFSNYDSIPTRNVLVEECRFLPIKDSSGNITSYAPNPIGSHNYEVGYLFEDIVFKNNYVEDCHYDYESSTGGWIRFYGVNNVKILDNTFTATKSQNCRVISIQTKAIDGSTTSSHGVEISGNKLTGFNGSLTSAGQALISVYGLENYNLENIIIENNSFIDCYDTTTDLANDKGNDLIYVKYGSDVKINGNYCNISRRLIMVTYSDRIIAENNMITKSYKNGIYFDNCTNYEVSNNIFDTTNNSLYLSNNKVGKIDSNTFVNNLDMLLNIYKQVVALKAESGIVISNNVFKNTNSTETFECLIKAYGSPSDLYFLHNKGFGYTIPVINAPSQTNIVIDLGIEGIVDSIGEQLMYLDSDLADLSIKVEDVEDGLTAQTSTIGTLKTSVASLQTDNTTNKSNISNLKTDVTTLKTDNTTNKNNITTIMTKPEWKTLSSIATYNTNKGVKDYNTSLTPRIMKDVWGRVYLEGCLTHTYNSSDNSNVLLFTLPEGYRPAKNHDFVTIASGNDKFNRIIVRPNGTVTITYTNSTGTTPYDVLEGITFTTY